MTRKIPVAIAVAVSTGMFLLNAIGTPRLQKLSDVVSTSEGDIKITPLVHASVMLEFRGKVIYVDPTSRGNVAELPKADLILITDIHGDHMDRAMVTEVKKETTVIIAPAAVARTITEARVLANGESMTVAGIHIEAVPMYNLVRGPGPGQLYHPKGRGNGYILTRGARASTSPETRNACRRSKRSRRLMSSS